MRGLLVVMAQRESSCKVLICIGSAVAHKKCSSDLEETREKKEKKKRKRKKTNLAEESVKLRVQIFLFRLFCRSHNLLVELRCFLLECVEVDLLWDLVHQCVELLDCFKQLGLLLLDVIDKRVQECHLTRTDVSQLAQRVECEPLRCWSL